MESIIREIGDVTIMVNPHASNEVFFEESFLKSKSIKDSSLSPSRICQIIAEENFIPMLLTWELLDKCSFACPFCYIVGHSNSQVVRFKNIESELQKLIDRGLFYCMITGGEPTLHKDFFEIYKFLKKRGVIVEVYTNGSLINEKLIDLFLEYQPYRIEISVYSITQNNFNIVSATDSFDCQKVLDNILKLKEKGFNIRCKTPINTLTLKEFSLIQEWCRQNGIFHYYSTNTYNAYDGTDLSSYEIDLETSIIYEIAKEQEFKEEHFDSSEKPKRKTCFSCGVKNYGLNINSNFELTPCPEAFFSESKSNILDVGIDQAISKYRTFIQPFIGKAIEGCIACEASDHCKMCSTKAKPIRNKLGDISSFYVPKAYCKTQRSKYKMLRDKQLKH